MSYSYTDGDKIASPNTYFYTEYNGQEFLNSYFGNRKSILRKTKDAVEPTFSENVTETDQSLIQTSIYLDYLYTSLQSQNHSRNADIFAEINLILKKFEVSKRIYDFYLPEFKKSDDSDFKNLNNYLKLASVLSRSYEITKKLNYLNGMLKVIDTLISVFNEMSELEKKNLAWLIRMEIDHVGKLTSKLRISS
mgnify:CR=1 FL=1|tara:strand:+ start:2050 stop:2628 length:579 start_codon:yes stop_codon:yes gene_type:complete